MGEDRLCGTDATANCSPVFLVRHGETEFNRDGRYQGRIDSPLTDRGRNQAKRIGAHLAMQIGTRSVRICTSPLGRAVETAKIIAEYLHEPVAPAIDDRLVEVRMGRWEGMTREEVRAGWPDVRRDRPGRNWIFHGPGCEPMDAARARAAAFLRDMAADPSGTGLVIVSHAFSGRLLRGVHGGLSGEDAMCLDAPQDRYFELLAGGRERPMNPDQPQGFQA